MRMGSWRSSRRPCEAGAPIHDGVAEASNGLAGSFKCQNSVPPTFPSPSRATSPVPTKASKNHPYGIDGEQLHGWVVATKSRRALHTIEGGEAGIDDDFAAPAS